MFKIEFPLLIDAPNSILATSSSLLSSPPLLQEFTGPSSSSQVSTTTVSIPSLHSGGMGLRLSKLTSGSGGRGRKLSGGFGGHICKVQCHRGVIWGHVYDSWSYKVVADELFSH